MEDKSKSRNANNQDERTLEKFLASKAVSWIGNHELLKQAPENCIGVFSDYCNDSSVDYDRCQWAMLMGRSRKCIVGTFNSTTEKEILRIHLRHGGSAVWLLGTAFPAKFNRDCRQATCEGRLLVLSCFWLEKRSFAAYRFCCQLTSMCSRQLVFWSMGNSRYSSFVYRNAVSKGLSVKRYG